VADPLLIVDVQNGLLNDFTRHVPKRIVRLIERGEWEPLIFTRFVNTGDSPYQRFLDWHACAGPPETELADELGPFLRRGRVFTKQGRTGLPGDARDYLREQGFNRINVVGIDTDMCVLKSAMDIFDMNIQPIVLADCCASTLGAYAHLAGLAILSRNIGPPQLRDAEMGDAMGRAPEGRS
jgi:nicotinamidase-related amidase